jgi:hypothetical protein
MNRSALLSHSCEHDGDLENMEMASERVTSIDEAIGTIREVFVSATLN